MERQIAEHAGKAEKPFGRTFVGAKDRGVRILDMYTRLMNGQVIYREEEALKYGVDVRSIQRDLRTIRETLDRNSVEFGQTEQLIYDKKRKGYCIVRSVGGNSLEEPLRFTNSEVLATCKILLESRAFCKKDMEAILGKLLENCVPADHKRMVEDMIRNERFNYCETRNVKPIENRMWDMASAIQSGHCLEITYVKSVDKSEVVRKIKPVAILFSEFYFYLAAFLENVDPATFHKPYDKSPTIYRMDRILNYRVLDETFYIPYRDRFQEGEFRKRVQFMFGGELKVIRFYYKGYDVDAVLDRLPTAEILKKDEKGWLIRAEVFGSGIDMWLRSQGEYVEKL